MRYRASQRSSSLLHGLIVSIVMLCAIAFLVSPVRAAMSFPPLTGRVADDAGILSQDTRDQLTSMLAQEEQRMAAAARRPAFELALRVVPIARRASRAARG